MPGVMIERPKMTRTMYHALKRHIMRERDRLKQEQEQDEAAEKQKKEQELKKKKEEQDSLTLEETKEQIAQVQTKLEGLRKEKSELFSQLKKVLHQEDESKKRAQIKEHDEMVALQQQQYRAGIPVANHPAMYHMQPKPPIKYMTIPAATAGLHHHHTPQATATHHPTPPQQPPQPPPPQPGATVTPTPTVGVKRSRSPTPPPSSHFQHYSTNKFPPSSYAGSIKSEPPFSTQSEYGTKVVVKSEPGTYPNATTHVTYATQAGHSYHPPPAGSTVSQTSAQTVAGPAPGYQGKYGQTSGGSAGGQSAFQSYPNHYAHQQQQKPLTESAHYPVTSYQRLTQPGYMGSSHSSSNLSLQQQLEHANQKSGFAAEDKFKMQQLRGMAPIPAQQHPASHMSTASPSQPGPAPAKGGTVSGFAVRTTMATYPQSSVAQSSHSSPHTAPPSRPPHAYANQPQNRYY